MKRCIILVLIIFSVLTVFAQKEYHDIYIGNRQYRDSSFVNAENNYRKAIDKNNKSYEAHYNLGDALFRQEKYNEALEEYQTASGLVNADNKEQISKNYHNIGNCYYAQQQYDKAIQAYQQSLRNNPKDDETRYNLIKAMQMLHQQQQEQQNQKEQQEQQNKDQQQQNQQQNQQQQEQQQQNAEEQPTEEQNDQQMSKEQAEQLLQALEQDEKETQEKAKQAQQIQQPIRRTDKDW